MQKEKNIFSVYKWTIMTKAISGPRSASQICYYIVPVLYLREDQEPGWHFGIFLSKGMGPVELGSTLTTTQSWQLWA